MWPPFTSCWAFLIAFFNLKKSSLVRSLTTYYKGIGLVKYISPLLKFYELLPNMFSYVSAYSFPCTFRSSSTTSSSTTFSSNLSGYYWTKTSGVLVSQNHGIMSWKGPTKVIVSNFWFHIGPQRGKPFPGPIGSAVPVVPQITFGSLC